MNELLSYFPPSLRRVLNGRCVTDIQLRCGHRSTVVCYQNGKSVTVPLEVRLDAREMSDLLSRLCRGSVYAFSESLCEGYITLSGGIRVGVVGRATVKHGSITAISEVTGLTFRIPRPVRGAADGLVREFCSMRQGILIFGPPGSGKTTLLRELAREITVGARPLRCAVVDSREELCDFGEECAVDVLRGYPKGVGVEIAVRTLAPEVVILDELGYEEAESLARVQCMGVPIVASAHGKDRAELAARPSLAALLRSGVFPRLYDAAKREWCQ